MKNKRFASLFLASMMALQLATPLSAREVETQVQVEETEGSTFNGKARTVDEPTFSTDNKDESGNNHTTITTDWTTLFDVVPVTEGTDTTYYLAETDTYQEPSHDDYTFQGWEDSNGDTWVFATVNSDETVTAAGATPVEDGDTITAVWTTKEITGIAVKTAPTKVTYTAGDNFDPAGLIITVTYDNGTTAESVAYNDTDFSYDEPTLSSSGNETVVVTYTDSFENTEDFNVVITVTAAATQYTVQFYDDKDGNPLGSALTATSGATISTADITEPTKAGYTFAGWYYNNGTEFKLGETKVTSDMEIYATWTALSVDSITLKTNPTRNYTVGDNFVPSGLEIKVIYSDDSIEYITYSTDNASAFSFTPALDYKLTYEDKEVVVTYGGQTTISPLEVTYPTGTDTVKANIDLEGGSIGGSSATFTRTIIKGDTIPSVGTPTQEGFVFDGWFYLDSGENVQSFVFGTTPVNVDGLTVYATWTSTTNIDKIEVKTDPLAKYTAGDFFDPTDLVIGVTTTGGDFTQVFYTEDTADSFSFDPDLDKELTASDSKVTIGYGGKTVDFPITVNKKEFTIKLETNGGTLNGSLTPASVTVTDGDVLENIGTPERSKHKFIYWYFKDSEDKEEEFLFMQTKVESDMTLYAKWEEIDNPIVGIEISRYPDSLSYTEGENFNPSGLQMKITYEDDTEETVTYNTYSADDFSFSPSLTTALTLEDTKITFTYQDYSAEYSIDILVKEDDRWVTGFVRDYQEEVVNGAILSFRQNNVELYSTSTNGSGLYEIQNLEAGTYTLTATYGNRTASSIVILTGYSQNLATIYLPRAQSSTNIIANSMVPFVQVSNMDAVAEELSTGESADTLISVDLEITNNYPSTDVEYMEAYKGTNEVLGAFLDISLYKSLVFSESSNTGRLPISEISTLMEITLDLPAACQGKGTYYVYRMHNGELEKLSSVANDFGEKVQVNSAKDQIVITTRRFSTYAIAYKEVSDSDDDNYYDGYVGSDRYTITTNKIVNGEATNWDIGGSIYLSTTYPIHNTKVTVSLTPYLGFVVDYVTATDAYGNNVSVYPEDDNYTFNQGGSEVTLTVAFRNIPIPTSPDGYTGFYDVNEGDWFYLTVLTAANLELMVGKGYGIFEPNSTTTRAEIVQVLYNLAGSPQVSTISTFSDVLGYEWYYHAVNWAQSISLVEGYGDQTFRPNQAITREELSSLFFAYAQTDPNITPILWPFSVEYSDHESISPWALESVRWCTNKGLFSGKTGNFFGPQDAATRAEVAHCLLAITDRAVL